jgi:hypothetical protein
MVRQSSSHGISDEVGQMPAAVEDAKRFLDMERTYALVVDEKTAIGEEVRK